MRDPLENPLGLHGFEFVEFASVAPGVIERWFDVLGFTRIARHRSRDAALYRQGGINFVVNNAPDCVDACLAGGDGPYASGLAFRVQNANDAFSSALALGAAPLEAGAAPVALRVPPLQGIGGIPLYLVDQGEERDALYADFEFVSGVDPLCPGHGLQAIDHVAHAVYGGRLSYWTRFYERLFGSDALRCHDILGTDCRAGRPRAEGIRHIALRSDDLITTIEGLRMAGVPLLELPSGHADRTASCLLLRIGADAGSRHLAVETCQRGNREGPGADCVSPSVQRTCAGALA